MANNEGRVMGVGCVQLQKVNQGSTFLDDMHERIAGEREKTHKCATRFARFVIKFLSLVSILVVEPLLARAGVCFPMHQTVAAFCTVTLVGEECVFPALN